MARKSTLAFAFVTSASLLAAGAAAQSAAEGERTYTTSLTGATEVPGPGDADGSGSATVTVSVPKKEVCFKLTVANLDNVTAAHIHLGAAGAAGPVSLGLAAPVTGSSEGCATVDARLAAQLLARPKEYYVNVHSTANPAGAVRGQLGK